MKRLLFTILSVISAVLCAAMCVMLHESPVATPIASYGDSFGYGFGTHDVRLQFCWREVGIEMSSYVAPHTPTLGFFHEREQPFNDTSTASPDFSRFHPDPNAVPFWLWMGFGRSVGQWCHYGSEYGPSNYVISNTVCYFAPLWMVCVATAILPAVWIIHRLRAWRPRRPAGCCRECGYDLRATPNRCPECGTPVIEGEG